MVEGIWKGRGSCAEEMRRMERALHDLCQPVTTLQCGLEIAELDGSAEGYREAVRLGLGECARILGGIDSIREILQAASWDAEPGGSEIREEALLSLRDI
jgi:hypothetical protein